MKLVTHSLFQFPKKSRRKHNEIFNTKKKARESKPNEITEVLTDDSYSNDKFEDEENMNSSNISSSVVEDNNHAKKKISIDREKVRSSR